MRRSALALASRLGLGCRPLEPVAAAAALLGHFGPTVELVHSGPALHSAAAPAVAAVPLPPPAAPRSPRRFSATAAAVDAAVAVDPAPQAPDAATAAAGPSVLDAAPPAAPEAPAAADGEQQQQPKQQQRAPWRPVDPASPLGRLMACRGVGEMRAWRQGLQESGGFGAFELGAAIRNAVRAKGMSAGEREAYMRELLGLAGGVQLDSRAAAYLAWGPAKLGLPADDPGVAAALTLAMQHVDGMEARDAAALLWALGALRASPQEAQLQALLGRLEGQLSGLRVKDLTQAAVGALRLQPAPSAFLAELLRALDVKVPAEQWSMEPQQIGALLQVLPRLPGAAAGASPAVDALYDVVVARASKLPLDTLASAVFEAKKLRLAFSKDQLKAVLDAAASKLDKSSGPDLQSLLHGLVLHDVKARQAPHIEKFLRAAALRQAKTVGRGRKRGHHAAKLVCSLGSLRVTGVPDDVWRGLLEVMRGAERGLAGLDRPWLVQMAFRRLDFAEGVDALEPYARSAQWQQQKQQKQQRKQKQKQKQEQEQEQQGTGSGQEPQRDEDGARLADGGVQQEQSGDSQQEQPRSGERQQ